MKILLLGDVHLYHLYPKPWQLFSKRVLGLTNLWLNRRKHFDLNLLPPLLEKIQSINPDLILASGDLTTTALPIEFRAAAQHFTPLFKQARAILVPGNHDRYTFTNARHQDFETAFPQHTTTHWPSVQRVAPNLVVVGLDTTKPNIISDKGYLPKNQLRDLRIAIDQLEPNDQLIVLSHYTLGVPPNHHPEAPRHALINADQILETLLAAPPNTLYLHGHVHQPWLYRHPQTPNLLALNAGAPLHTSKHWPQGQGFWTIDLPTPDDSPDTPDDLPVNTNINWSFTHHAMIDNTFQSQTLTPPTQPNQAAPLTPTGQPL